MRNVIPATLPDIEALRCFVAAARTLHFKTAASLVALAPSSLSQRVRTLEEQLGEPLFARSTRSVSLTRAGEALLPYAQRCLEEARTCIEVVQELDEPPPYTLTLGVRYELGLAWLTPALTELRESLPERQIHLRFGDTPELLAAARTGAVDAVIVEVRAATGDLRFAALHEAEHVLVGEPRLVAELPLEWPEDAMSHTILDTHPGLPLFQSFLDAAPLSDVWAFRGAEFLGTAAAVRYRALEGAGVAVLPRHLVREDLRSGNLVPLVERITPRRACARLIWRCGHPRDGEMAGLAEELRAIPVV